MIDSFTNLQVSGTVRSTELHNVSTIDHNSDYANILNEFPQITRLQNTNDIPTCDAVHHIITTGHPIAQRARRLCHEKMKIVKEQFQDYIKAGICRPSSGPWASPIVIKQKKDGSWRIWGDYRRLNSVTEPDRSPRLRCEPARENHFFETRFV